MKVSVTVPEGKWLVRPDGDPEKDFEAEGSFEVEADSVFEVRRMGVGDLPENHKPFDLADPVGRSD